MNRLFSTFDPTELGASMALEQANTIVVTTGIASINRMVKALYGKSSSQWFAEFAFYGNEPLTGAVSVGIASETSPLTGYVGEDANSYGYRAGDGEIHNNGSSIASVATAVAGDIIGVLVNIGDGTAASVTWFLNGEVLHTESIAGGVWFLAATVKTATSDPMRAWINTGQRDFEYPVPGVDGWFDLAEDVPAVLVSTDDYISPTTDTLPNAVWEGMIADDGVEIVSEVKFWVDGDVKMARGSATSVQVAHNGEFDWLLAANTRDVPALLQTVDRRGSFDSAETVATMIVDDVQAVDQGTMRFNLTTTMSQFDRPLQTRIFPPSADVAVAGKPWPIALGAARQVTPVLVDPVNRIYALTDRGIVGIGYVRDKGAPLDPGALPPGYVLGSDFRTIVLETNPEGKLTADVSNQGGSVPPTLSDDIWDGYGDPFTEDSSGGLANFDQLSNATYVSPGRARLTSPGLSGSAYLGLSTATITAGRSYRYHVDLATVPGVHSFGTPVVSIAAPSGIPLAAWTAPGVYEGVFTALATVVPRLILQDALPGSSALINRAYILEIPDTYDPAIIQPITFTDFMREIVEVRANMQQSAWSLDDAQAIDTDTGYTGVGFFESGSLTIRGAIDSIMSSYTACAYNDEDDVLRFTRLLDPAGQTPVGEITEDDLLAELTCKNDLAPGLSTQMHFRKNWTAMNETDFVSDFITVPGEVRRALGEPYQGIVASALPLPGMYRHAIYASPIGTLLDNEEDAQAEIDRIVGYYGVPRFFYTVEVSDEDFPAELGEVWTLTNSRYELTAGKPLQVCKVIRRPIAGTRQITLRG